jgi:hypothetical protein
VNELPADHKRRAEFFRNQAREIMQLSESGSEAVREEYLRLATEWLKLAEEADRLYGSNAEVAAKRRSGA